MAQDVCNIPLHLQQLLASSGMRSAKRAAPSLDGPERTASSRTAQPAIPHCWLGSMSSLSLRPLSVTSCDPSRLPPIHETHTRPVPLPHYVSIETDDPSLTAGHYAGQGKSKVCYRLCTSTQNWRDAPRALLKQTPQKQHQQLQQQYNNSSSSNKSNSR